MAIDDKLGKTLGEFEAEIVASPGNLVLDAALNALPYIGSSISSLLAGKAQERVRERTAEVFREMKAKLDSVDEQAIRKDYFESEEFQTLLALAIDQLQTSHDKEKLKFLSKALVNSGLTEFEHEHGKELFVRALREITPAHIRLLAEFLPHRIGPNRIVVQRKPQAVPHYSGDRLLVSYLVALGFLEEVREGVDVFETARRKGRQLRPEEALGLLNSGLKHLSERKFILTQIGKAFLTFVDVTEPPTRPNHVREISKAQAARADMK